MCSMWSTKPKVTPKRLDPKRGTAIGSVRDRGFRFEPMTFECKGRGRSVMAVRMGGRENARSHDDRVPHRRRAGHPASLHCPADLALGNHQGGPSPGRPGPGPAVAVPDVVERQSGRDQLPAHSRARRGPLRAPGLRRHPGDRPTSGCKSC